ncbi:SCAN domain-containing protein 3 [Trichonephila clavipes]|nr:SCAN domain-containing protein 3 [Trichonephila clavipes]
MTGHLKGFVAHVKELNEDILVTHCFLHREALVTKFLPSDLKIVLEQCVKMVNYIKSRPLKSRLFSKLCQAMEAKYESLLLHTEGDGDSKGFISVKDTYGKDSVTKYECIGHVQKRVGARLRKPKSKNKNLSGKGKLIDSFTDRLQNYYGIAVRSNVGNLSGLQQNVLAALFHCSSSVEKSIHGQCPIGKDSWCYYQRELSCGKKPNEKYKGLSNEVLNMIKPTYLELCTKEMLTKCLHGKTKNSNECLNGVIWQRVPKEVFVCLKTLRGVGNLCLSLY